MGSLVRKVTLRRNVQQSGHCVAEALSVIEQGEDLFCALDDLEQARSLLDSVIGQIKDKCRNGRE